MRARRKRSAVALPAVMPARVAGERSGRAEARVRESAGMVGVEVELEMEAGGRGVEEVVGVGVVVGIGV